MQREQSTVECTYICPNGSGGRDLGTPKSLFHTWLQLLLQPQIYQSSSQCVEVSPRKLIPAGIRPSLSSLSLQHIEPPKPVLVIVMGVRLSCQLPRTLAHLAANQGSWLQSQLLSTVFKKLLEIPEQHAHGHVPEDARHSAQPSVFVLLTSRYRLRRKTREEFIGNVEPASVLPASQYLLCIEPLREGCGNY